jgi:signal peptidase II
MVPKLALIFLAMVLAIGCDRVTKHLAVRSLAGHPEQSWLADTVRLQYAENTGGFLSFGADWAPATRNTVFTRATGAILLVLGIAAYRARHHLWSGLGLSLFVAGAASNWLDRITRGSVVDFLNVGIGPVRTGIFNVADMAIMLGVAMFVLAKVSHKPPSADVEPEAPKGPPFQFFSR